MSFNICLLMNQLTNVRCCCFILISFIFTADPVMARKHQMNINGSAAFESQVSSCLDVLFENYPHAYKFVNKHIGIIAQSRISGMIAWNQPPIYQMSSKTANYSLTWCASTIAHDAYHSFLYKKHRPKNGSRTPERYWADFKAEILSIIYQIRVAKKIGAPQYELDYLDTLDGKHADVDGNGTVNLKDYAERDW